LWNHQRGGGPSWPNGCHICEVELDTDTGDVQVVAYASVNDVGRVINPMIVRGQLDGGVVQGLGRHVRAPPYDRESGQLVTGTLMDYAVPHADIMGPMVHEPRSDDAMPEQSAGRERRGRTGHHRRHTGAGERCCRCLARNGLLRWPPDSKCRSRRHACGRCCTWLRRALCLHAMA
jgi:carbon-monoxide dehydrogenase large subunit